MAERSIEANKLDADLAAGRLMEQAVHQAQRAYHFSPSTYTYECLSAVLRLKRKLKELLQPAAGEPTPCSSLPASPQQDILL